MSLLLLSPSYICLAATLAHSPRFGIFQLIVSSTSGLTQLHACSDYPLKKIQENNEAEILQTVLDEAKDSYTEEIVVELQSETTEHMESNLKRIVQWIENWIKDNNSTYRPQTTDRIVPSTEHTGIDRQP